MHITSSPKIIIIKPLWDVKNENELCVYVILLKIILKNSMKQKLNKKKKEYVHILIISYVLIIS